MHTYLEHYLEGQGILDLTDIGQEAERMDKSDHWVKGLPDLERNLGPGGPFYIALAGMQELQIYAVFTWAERVFVILN